MELHYRVTPEHNQARFAKRVAEELAKDQRRAISALRWAHPLLAWLGLPSAYLVIYLFNGFNLESVLAFVVVGAIFIPYWWHVVVRRAVEPKPLAVGRFHQRVVEMNVRQQLSASEGRYRLVFDDQGFIVTRSRKLRSGRLAWGEITQVRENAHLYAISSAALDRKGLAYHIARHSDLMPAEEYQQALAAFLSNCPPARTEAASSLD